MRPERLYLQDMVEAADNIAFHIAGRSREHFLGDRTVRAAVLHELTVIGEAAARLAEEFRGRHPERLGHSDDARAGAAAAGRGCPLG